MASLYNFFALMSARLLSIVGFFLISAVLSAHEFRDYAFYFSAWQITAQLVCLQLGVALFRFGASSEYFFAINTMMSFLVKMVIPLFLLMLGIIVADFGIYAICVAMALLYSVFTAIAEYARSQIKESIVFWCYGVNGAASLIIFLLNKFMEYQFSLREVLVVEAIVYSVVTFYLAYNIPRRKYTYSDLVGAARAFYPLWKRISLPLIPSNMIWYAYFNAPQLVFYFVASSAESYNYSALLMRAVVALSTFASVVAVSFQKKIIFKFDSDVEGYLDYRTFVLYRFLPSLSICMVLLSALLGYSGIEKIFAYSDFMRLLFDVRVLFSVVFCLFVLNYGTAQFLIAEKNTLAAAQTMYLGFLLYLSAATVLLFSGVDLSLISIYAMVLGLFLTYIVRVYILSGAGKC